MLDDIFSRYLMERNDREFCRDASQFLTGVSRNKIISVTITELSKSVKEPFFGMRIFPDESEIDSLCQCLLEDNMCSLNEVINQWKNISKWHLEIDSRVFDRTVISFNPEELTAMTLHEIGHVVYSDRKPEQYFRAYQNCRIRMKSTDLVSARIVYFLYQIPLIMACGLKNWSLTSRDMHEEIFADTTVERLGYGEALVSAYQKIIKEHGNSLGAYTEAESEAELERSITWCNLNAKDLAHRKNKLKDDLYYTGTKSGSPYIRKVLHKVMAKAGIVSKARYTGNIVVESSITMFDDVETFVNENELIYDIKSFNKLANRINSATESMSLSIAQEAFGKKGKIQVPTQLDVDTIFVEVDRISNHADRRYVLDLIYHQEEKIEKFKELFQYNHDLESKYAGKMESMLKELAEMRKAVLAKRSFDKNYKVFVKYPEGYEG
jgi:hypothetical protein